jgi:molecular chaperone DnaK (HSP70)
MATHEITAADCHWADINFESPKEAFNFADKLEQRLKDPTISEEEKKRIDDALDDLFSTLFDCMF